MKLKLPTQYNMSFGLKVEVVLPTGGSITGTLCGKNVMFDNGFGITPKVGSTIYTTKGVDITTIIERTPTNVKTEQDSVIYVMTEMLKV